MHEPDANVAETAASVKPAILFGWTVKSGKSGAWHVAEREGKLHGPFDTHDEAERVRAELLKRSGGDGEHPSTP